MYYVAGWLAITRGACPDIIDFIDTNRSQACLNAIDIVSASICMYVAIIRKQTRETANYVSLDRWERK